MPPQDDRSRYRQFEGEFFRLLHSRAEQLVQRRGVPAGRVIIEPMPEGADFVTAALLRLRKPDPQLRESLPGRRASRLRFQQRTWGGLATRTLVNLRARALYDLESLVNGAPPRPIGRDDVLDALARYDLLPEKDRPSAVALASLSGFTPEARALVHSHARPTLILLSGRSDGGWEVETPAAVRKLPWAALFELESQDQRLARLLSHLERAGAELAARGVAVDELAARLALAPAQTLDLLRQGQRSDPRLMLVQHEGRLHVCRSPLAEEDDMMRSTWWSTVRRWLGLKPTAAEQVRALTARRIQIEQQRVDLDQRVTVLEAEERDALARGAAAAADAEKKQIAARLARIRTDLKRARAQEQIATQQINILSTHAYHLTLREQGKRMELPSREELTREAATAEQIVKELSTNADLARSIEVGAQSSLMADEEDAILKEFDQLAASRRDSDAVRSAAPAAGRQETAPPLPSSAEAPGGQTARTEAKPEAGGV